MKQTRKPSPRQRTRRRHAPRKFPSKPRKAPRPRRPDADASFDVHVGPDDFTRAIWIMTDDAFRPRIKSVIDSPDEPAPPDERIQILALALLVAVRRSLALPPTTRMSIYFRTTPEWCVSVVVDYGSESGPDRWCNLAICNCLGDWLQARLPSAVSGTISHPIYSEPTDEGLLWMQQPYNISFNSHDSTSISHEDFVWGVEANRRRRNHECN